MSFNFKVFLRQCSVEPCFWAIKTKPRMQVRLKTRQFRAGLRLNGIKVPTTEGTSFSDKADNEIV